jgi:RNA polymerase sigma factor (sigma-70 family)
MDDREIVAAIAAGDPDGLADAYGKYAESLYGYCRWILPEPGDAADAVRDTFALAARQLGHLRDPGKVRSWLFSTARSECLRRSRSEISGASEADGFADLGSDAFADLGSDGFTALSGSDVFADLGSGDFADLGSDGFADLGSDGFADPGGTGRRDAERAELRRVIHVTLAKLTPDEREAVQLSLWHDLDDTDLAAVLDVSRPRAYALASNGRRQLEKALGALRIARSGRDSCPELGALLADWDGRLTVPTLNLATLHIDQCEGCTRRRRGRLRPEVLGRLLPLPALPPELREKVLGPAIARAGTADRRPLGPTAPPSAAARLPRAAGVFAGLGGLAGRVKLAEWRGLAGRGGLVGLHGWAGRVKLVGLRGLRGLRGLAGRGGLAGWDRVRRNPKVAAAVAVVFIAAAVSIPLMAVGGAHAVRDLGAQTPGGALGAGGLNGSASGGPPNGAPSSPATGTSPSPQYGALVPANYTKPSAGPPRQVTPSKSARPKASGPPPVPVPSSPASSSPPPSPLPSLRESSTPAAPTPTPTPSPSPSPSPSPVPTSS